MAKTKLFRRILIFAVVCIISALFSHSAKAQCPIVASGDPCGTWSTYSIPWDNGANPPCPITINYCYRWCNNEFQAVFSGIDNPNGCSLDFGSSVLQSRILMGLPIIPFLSNMPIPPCPEQATFQIHYMNAACYHYINPTTVRACVNENGEIQEIGCEVWVSICSPGTGSAITTYLRQKSYSQICPSFNTIDNVALSSGFCFSICGW